MISIIIPTFNEAEVISETLFSLERFSDGTQKNKFDVHIVDGGSTDGTEEIVQQLIDSRRLKYSMNLHKNIGDSRGSSMAYGFTRSKGNIVLFLHADSRLHANALLEIEKIIGYGNHGGAFPIKFVQPPGRSIYRGIEAFIYLRARFFKMFHGDQGMFVRHDVLENIGGYPEIPLMEDVKLSQLLRSSYRLKLASIPIYASPRRIAANGFIKMVYMYFYLKTLYYMNFDINYIAQTYKNLKKG